MGLETAVPSHLKRLEMLFSHKAKASLIEGDFDVRFEQDGNVGCVLRLRCRVKEHWN